MVAPNTNYTDIITTTIEARSRELADNIGIHGPLLQRLNARGNVDFFNGGSQIVEELEYAENSTFKWYTGFETIDLQPQEIFSAAQFDMKMLAGSVVISGQEMLQNAGEEAFIRLLSKRMKNAETSLKNNLLRGLVADGTANAGKQIGGLQFLLSSNPVTGTIGGIDRAQWAFWRNKRFRGVTDGGAAVTSVNIQNYMTQLALQLVRGPDYTDFVLADINYYNLYTQSLQPNFRVTSNDVTGAGFKSLKFFAAGNDCDIVFAGNGNGMPSNTMYFLNTNYLRLRPHKDRNMVAIGGDRAPSNQDGISRLLGWAGNMTCSNMALQGVLVA